MDTKIEFITKLRTWKDTKKNKVYIKYVIVVPPEVAEAYKLNEWANKPIKVSIELLQ